MHMSARSVAPCLAGAALAACGTVTTYQSAETLPCGSWHLSAAVSGGQYKDEPQQTRTPSLTAELSGRVGLTDDTEVTLKLYTLGAQAGLRHRIFDGADGGRRPGWSLAVLAAVGGVRTSGQGSLPEMILAQASAGALATRRTSAHLSWTLGALATGSLFVPAGGGHATGWLAGAMLGADWRFAARWHLVPELSLHRTVAGEVPVDGSVGQLGLSIGRDF